MHFHSFDPLTTGPPPQQRYGEDMPPQIFRFISLNMSLAMSLSIFRHHFDFFTTSTL